MYKTTLILIVVVFSSIYAKDIPEKSATNPKKSLAKDCVNSYSVTCLKLDIVSFVDKINEDGDFKILPGVSLVRDQKANQPNTAELVSELARQFPNDPEARLDSFLLRKVQGFLGSHSIKLNLFNQENTEVEESRKKKKGGLGMLLAAGAMMKGTLMALALGALAALAGKALMTGLISLLLSAIIGLKSLASGGEKATYEIVSKPVYTQSHTHSVSHEDHHGSGGYGGHSYGRSMEIPLPLGLQPNYKP